VVRLYEFPQDEPGRFLQVVSARVLGDVALERNLWRTISGARAESGEQMMKVKLRVLKMIFRLVLTATIP
jgi:hypothetical protein